MSSFTHLLSDFWYNSLGSTCTCPYLFVGTNVFQSASSSKSNIRFVGSPIVLQWEGRNTSIRCVIEVNEHLMESLFDRLSNGSCLNSISCQQEFQFIKTFCRCFYRDLHHRLGLVIHTWDPGPSWSTPQTCEEELKDDQGRPPPCHLLRTPARASNPSWRPNRIRLRFSFELREQPVLKQTSRSHTESDSGALSMAGKIISRHFQWHWSQVQIHPESRESSK